MAFVDLARNRLVLKVVVAGPPAVGKTTRLEHVETEGRFASFGSSVTGRTNMAVLSIEAEGASRPVEIELYEWHGPERADVRSKALFTGLDGLVYVADAREDRFVDTVNQFEFLVKEAGASRLRRLPGLLVLGQMDEGLLRLPTIEKRLQRGPTWSEKVSADHEDAGAFLEALKLFGELMLARIL